MYRPQDFTAWTQWWGSSISCVALGKWRSRQAVAQRPSPACRLVLYHLSAQNGFPMMKKLFKKSILWYMKIIESMKSSAHKKVVLECSHVHLFTHCLLLLSRHHAMSSKCDSGHMARRSEDASCLVLYWKRSPISAPSVPNFFKPWFAHL